MPWGLAPWSRFLCYDSFTLREIAWGLYAGLLTNLLVAAIGHSTWFDLSASAWLVTIGTANELLGVLLVASPELLPFLAAALAYVGRRAHTAKTRIERVLSDLLGLPPTLHRASASLGLPFEINTAGSVTPAERNARSLEEKVRDLLYIQRQRAERLESLDREIQSVQRLLRAEIEKTRTVLRGETEEAVRRRAEFRLRLRLLGLTYIVAGLILAWLGNVI